MSCVPYVPYKVVCFCRTKGVFFVLIVYFWDHELGQVNCASHTCVTPDLKKRNDQVTVFVETIFKIYQDKSIEEEHGQIKYLFL